MLSHVAILPALHQFYRRRWSFEFGVYCFAILTSFMYHTCQAFETRLFLSELQWHRLDNIGALGIFSTIFTYLSVIDDPFFENILKYSCFYFALIVQEHSPWNEVFTFIPIMMFAMLPIISHVFYHQKAPHYDWKNFLLAFGCLGSAIPFFVAGLDDANDPFRIYHGMWHLIAGYGCVYMWRIVKQPHATAMQAGRSHATSLTPQHAVNYWTRGM